ncbi:PadR family transcriptional regulator [Streptomyces sp. WMMC940]|uniref:PadR family transcriptional regulator n=1 Tax=Streptomyces sp. WMMC940 TaxID=3015153 RepID=UPI0022B738A8|nr:PadR family transcriptional regulator [Streptomyces sp. WMMC940]MCZ7456133.1 PadR family transcriptional regulator [Streptomyces sp. WMMC940]
MVAVEPGWLRGVLPLALAAVLAEGDRHGYALVQELTVRGFGTVRGGALYPVLGRLESEGVVEARWEPGEGGPGRKVYRLTDVGRARLREETSGWKQFSCAMDQLLARDAEELP